MDASRVFTSKRTDLENVPRLICVALMTLYIVNVIYAVVSQRALFADASYFLVRMLETGSVFHYGTSWQQVYGSRIVSNWLTQMPTVLATKVGVSSFSALSVIYSVSLFSPKIISVVVTYFILDRHDKRYIIFPIFSLFAGSIVSDIFIISESHVADAFLWPILAIITRSRRIGLPLELSLYAGIVGATFTYESWVFFAPLLMVVSLLSPNRIVSHHRRVNVIAALLLIVPLISNSIAVLHPRDAANEGGFVDGILASVLAFRGGIADWHAGVLASIVGITILLALLLSKRIVDHHRVLTRVAACVLAAAAAAVPVFQAVFLESGIQFSHAVQDRGVSTLVVQVVLVLAYFGCLHDKLPGFLTNFKIVSVVLGLLGTGQVAAQIVATTTWRESLTAVRQATTQNVGAIPCAEVGKFAPPGAGDAVDRIVCSWWAPSLSILSSGDGAVRAILTPSNQVFTPFNPLLVSDLPSFPGGLPNYRVYAKHLANQLFVGQGETVSFVEGGNGTLMLGPGFSKPEPWATWTDGRLAKLHLCIRSFDDYKTLRFIFLVKPLLDSAKRPELPVVIGVNNKVVGHWVFLATSAGASGSGTLTIDSQSWPAGSCGNITFSFPASLLSPHQMGLSNDPRRLGIAFVSMRVVGGMK